MGSIQDISNLVTSNRGALTTEQQNMVNQAPAEQQKYLEAQFKMENESQATQAISNILKKMDEMASAVIRNLA